MEARLLIHSADVSLPPHHLSSSNPPVTAEVALRSAGDNIKVREAQLETLVVAGIMLSRLKVAFLVSAAVILTRCIISLLIKRSYSACGVCLSVKRVGWTERDLTVHDLDSLSFAAPSSSLSLFFFLFLYPSLSILLMRPVLNTTQCLVYCQQILSSEENSLALQL